MHINAFSNYEKCRELWNRFIPQEVITDLWEFRDCFFKARQRELLFITAEKKGETVGFLPLCRIEESDTFGFFPGESWHGKTWLEQNRIIADSQETLETMLSYISGLRNGGYHLRYLLPGDNFNPVEDETGYLFSPPIYNYSMDEYYASFSGKSAKKIKKEVESFFDRNITIIIDNCADFDILVDMNISRFGRDSYFSDKGFREGFRNAMFFLEAEKMIRITSVLIGGQYAAVDLGSIYKNVYTLLAGGTSAGFPGVAKFINTLHLKYSCEEKFSQTDFLCGNFSWKTLFHLEPRPLYKVSCVDESVFDKIAEKTVTE